MSARSIDPVIARKIDSIDFTLAKQRLMDPKLGYGWSATKADNEIAKYRNFLKLASSGMSVVPTKDCDLVWHTCILDTETYARTCQEVFGYFLHHRPYMEDKQLKKNWENTNKAYESTFGETYSKKR